MQKYKEVDGDIVKLKLFPFSLRGRAKEWLQSLPRNSIDSWDKCKDAFIGKYYPPAKIIQLRSNIMNCRQLDNEHIAQAWERMKSLVNNFPTHGVRPDMRYFFRSGHFRPNPRTKHISIPPRHMTKSYILDFNMISQHCNYKDTTSHTCGIQVPEYITSAEDTCLGTDYSQMPSG